MAFTHSSPACLPPTSAALPAALRSDLLPPGLRATPTGAGRRGSDRQGG